MSPPTPTARRWNKAGPRGAPRRPRRGRGGCRSSGRAGHRLRWLVHKSGVPDEIQAAVLDAYDSLGPEIRVAVRSSATSEDTAGTSFAGMTDDRISQLRAGEALSAVLLTATELQLAICPLTQPLEIGTTRAVLRDRVLDGARVPADGAPDRVVTDGQRPLPAAPAPPPR
ncbi:MAG: PEP/pyruvate-binding domain-containing protein [Pseudonocardiaceae bacterium]